MKVITMQALAFRKNNIKKALEWYLKSKSIREEIKDSSGIATSHVEIGRVYFHLEDYEKAYKNLLLANSISKKIKINLTEKSAAKLYYQLLITMDSIDKAKQVLDNLLQLRDRDVKVNLLVLPEQRKELYINTMLEDYDLYFDYVHQYHKKYPDIVNEAYNHAVQIKGLMLKSSTAMRKRILETQDTALVQEYEDWIALKRKISSGYETGDNIQDWEEQALLKERALIKKKRQY